MPCPTPPPASLVELWPLQDEWPGTLQSGHQLQAIVTSGPPEHALEDEMSSSSGSLCFTFSWKASQDILTPRQDSPEVTMGPTPPPPNHRGLTPPPHAPPFCIHLPPPRTDIGKHSVSGSPDVCREALGPPHSSLS